jgi:hypothetical protein
MVTGPVCWKPLSIHLCRAMQVVSLLTQTTVSPDDPAFEDPQKFIGPMYSKEDADRCASGAFQTAGGLPGDQGRAAGAPAAGLACGAGRPSILPS